MGLDELDGQLERNRRALGDDVHVPLDGQSRDELALLAAVLGTDADEVMRRAVHEYLRVLLGNQVLDAHLRQKYDVAYNEYLAGRETEDLPGEGSVRGDDDRGFL
ncbi:MAG: hypothetical protein ACI9QA_000583 [Methanobacteriota archaeon]|jgi:hypothetical protein|uniref:Ribbon-helix-helix protein, copG family n=1 Tax=Halorutilus salinus TaxID=2487751 RepID=A0A9Q4C475_9EURY|nr:hypothetical protein [Halorutilus salinus]MCX2819555.1 hypothetical protein [Halorutilus salinus]